jgi:uncharacterized membrane protein HdeD (DUF308 family)
MCGIIVKNKKERKFMSNKSPLKNNHTRTIVISCIALVIGILLCCSISLGQLLSWFIGIAISLCGVMYIVNSILQKKSVLNADAILGAILTAFGVMFIIDQMASIIIAFLPYLMIAVGVHAMTDLTFMWAQTAQIGAILLGGAMGASIKLVKENEAKEN